MSMKEVSTVLVFERITFNPEIIGGQASIRGTRMPVSVIQKMFACGHTYEEILDDYPYVEEEDITQSLRYAAWIASGQSEDVGDLFDE